MAARDVFCDSWFQCPSFKGTDIEHELPKLFKKTLFFNERVAGRDRAAQKLAGILK